MTKKINVEQIILLVIVLVMILIPILKFSTYIPSIANFYINVFEIKRVYVLWFSIFFLLVIYLYLIFSGKAKVGWVDIIVYVLIILAFLSASYALEFHTAVFGERFRHEGLLTMLSYYFLILNAKSINNEKYKKYIIYLFIFIGVIQSIYAILQSYTNFTFIRRHSISYMAMGLCSNPNFFGSYMVMQLLLVGYMYVYNRKRLFLVLFTLFGITLYIAESTGPVLSAVVAIIFSLIIMRKKFKVIIRLILVLFLSFAFADLSLKYVQNHMFEQQLIESYDISNDISTITRKSPEQIGSGRLVIWKNSLPLVKKYWLFGCGLDNFKNAYPNWSSLKYDKAHNVYLQIAVTNGIPALIVFLILLFNGFIKGLKNKNVLLTPLYMAFIGYSIQAFFNISVTDVAPYYYIILGLVISEFGINNSLEICEKEV